MSQDEVIKKIDQAGKINLKRQHKQRGGGETDREREERAERTVNIAFSICRI